MIIRILGFFFPIFLEFRNFKEVIKKKKLGKMMVRNVVMVMLFVTVIAPIVLYTDRLGSFHSSSSSSCKCPLQICSFVFFYFCFYFIVFLFSCSLIFTYSLASFPVAANEFVDDVTTFVSDFSLFWKNAKKKEQNLICKFS